MITLFRIPADFIKDIFAKRRVIIQLVQNDLKSRYAGSAFGIIWAYIQPLVNMLVMWFVFQVGFRNPPVNDIEFILWYLSANIPWLFFNDGIVSSANCLYEYGYLVKKMRFRTSLLPIIKVLSALFIHIFFIFFACFMFEIYGYAPRLMWLQVLYYSFADLCLMIGLSWLVASVSVFFKDFAQMVSISMSILFWLTPIFWDSSSMSAGILKFFRLNPLYYIVNGYRQSLIYGVGFWQEPSQTLYFWCVTVVFFILGALVFRRLRPHFADLI